MLFKDAKVGDAVALQGLRRDALPVKTIITALTNTQVTVDGSKFTRSHGVEIGGGDRWNKRNIKPWTAEVEAGIASKIESEDRTKRKVLAESSLARASARITNRFGALTDDQINAVADLATEVDAAITAILGEKS
jgi:hypothetical protein